MQSLPLSLTSSLVEESTSFSLSVSPTDSAMVSLSVYHTLPSALESTARPTVELVHSETSQGVVEPSSSVILVSEGEELCAYMSTEIIQCAHIQ